jgi:hypothetical protein
MQNARTFRAVRKKVRIKADRRAEITGLPFAPGSEVEVIVVGPATPKVKATEKSIYDYTQSLMKKKRMPRYSMKQIEQIVHESRHSRGYPKSSLRHQYSHLWLPLERLSKKSHREGSSKTMGASDI